MFSWAVAGMDSCHLHPLEKNAGEGESWVFVSPHLPQQVFSQHGTEAKILMLFPCWALPFLFIYLFICSFLMIANAI